MEEEHAARFCDRFAPVRCGHKALAGQRLPQHPLRRILMGDARRAVTRRFSMYPQQADAQGLIRQRRRDAQRAAERPFSRGALCHARAHRQQREQQRQA